jgi:hypothetical protein
MFDRTAKFLQVGGFARFFVVAAFALLLAGCLTNSTLPEGYTGPTATIKDSVAADHENHGYFLDKSLLTRADFFYVSRIDGKRVFNSLGKTAGANSGAELRQNLSGVRRSQLHSRAKRHLRGQGKVGPERFCGLGRGRALGTGGLQESQIVAASLPSSC